MSTLPRIVFVVRNVRATREMSVTALMNRFCEQGYDVTLICETVCSVKYDFRYDHRVKRLSFSMGVKDCASRAELLAHFVAEMPPSVFIFTDFRSEAFRALPAVVKAASPAHRVIFLPHFLFAAMLDKRPLLLERLQALCGDADAIVSNTVYAHVTQNGGLGGKSVWFPYYYPFGEGEYRAVPPGGKAVLLFGSNPELVAGTMEQLAAFVKSDPEVTLRIPAGRLREKTVELYRECAQALGIEERVEYDESRRFDELAQGCVFAVVTSKFVYPCDVYMQMAARRLPVLFSSTYHEPAFLSADLMQEGDLAGRCAELMNDPSSPDCHADLSPEASGQTFELWEGLVADLAAGRPARGAPGLPDNDGRGEALLAHFDEIFTRERPEPEKRRRTLKQIRRRLRNKLRRSKLADFIRKKIYYKERLRVQKYAHIQLSPEQVRKAQLLALKMLFEFERICKKHGLRYYVAAGSLLGAARHGGPIPWDDDVDVTMPRPDYDRFLQIAQSELPEDMALPLNNYPYGFHRIQIRDTEITRYIRQKGPHGIFLDILPLDGAAPTQRLKERHWRRSRRLSAWMLQSTWPQPPVTPSLKRLRIWTKRLLIKRLVPKGLLYWLWKRNAAKYDAESAAEWVCMPGLYGYEKECFPKEYWGEPVYLRYEGREVPVMHEWEEYLISHYRDYMMPPPVLFRRTHVLSGIDFGRYGPMGIEEVQRQAEEPSRK